MKVEELIQRVQSIYSKGVDSDDSRLSRRHIYNKMLTARQRIVSQQKKKRQKVSDWNYVILPCVELIKVPSHECSCLGDLGCDIFRTKYPLPKVLTGMDNHTIEYVMSINNGMKIEETTREEFLYSRGNKYTSKKPKYVIEKGHLYFPIVESPGIIKIKLLPEDPIEAIKYPSYCNDCQNCSECISYADVDFPIDGDMIDTLIELTVAEVVSAMRGQIQDTRNNGQDPNQEEPQQRQQ
jgi:hypothetical protein